MHAFYSVLTSISMDCCRFLHDAKSVSVVANSTYQSLFFILLLNLSGFLLLSLWNLLQIAASCKHIIVVVVRIVLILITYHTDGKIIIYDVVRYFGVHFDVVRVDLRRF